MAASGSTSTNPARIPALGIRMLILLALSLLGAWWHLHRFDAEARGFDRILRRVPAKPRLLSLIFEPHGRVMATAPYLHFAAHVQARKGGLIATTFARFWNIPVRRRPGPGGRGRPPPGSPRCRRR